MAVYVVDHKVEDYEEWRKVYDAFQATAVEAGVKDQYVLTSMHDPNHVVVIGEGSIDDVQKFLSSDQLRSAMGEAGVSGEPSIFIGENRG